MTAGRGARSLAPDDHVVQWGGAHVWKVGGKVFAIAAGTMVDSFSSPSNVRYRL